MLALWVVIGGENRFSIIKENLVSLGNGDVGIVGGGRVKDN